MNISYQVSNGKLIINDNNYCPFCPFCQKQMESNGLLWLRCFECGVIFMHNAIFSPYGLHIKFSRTIKNWNVVLDLYPDDDKTVLLVYEKLSSYKSITLSYKSITLNYCMKNITPHNVVDKMKLLLVWQ